MTTSIGFSFLKKSTNRGTRYQRFGIQTKVEYFSRGLFPSHSFDLVVARLLLEHISNPCDFFTELNEVTRPGGYVALEIPECQSLMESGSIFWVIEHLSYFTPRSLGRVLHAAGFDAIVVDTSRSELLRAVGKKTHGVDQLTLQAHSSVALDVELAETFHERFSAFLSSVENYLNMARQAKWPIAVYGAGNFFTNLISGTSLTTEEIVAIFDSNHRKWGICIPGVNTPIQSPDSLCFPEIGLVIVATQGYEGVVSRLKPYFQEGGAALVFFPEPHLIYGATQS